jgi:predicted NodU family carbamoyl transferase
MFTVFWQRIVHKIAKKIGLYGTLDSEKALREKNHKIHLLEQQVEQLTQQVGFAQKAIAETTVKRHAIVYVDRTVQGAYDQPSPNTDPALQRRLQAQKRKLQEQEEEEEEKFKQLLDVNTQELRAIRAHPGGIKRSGVTNKYITQKLKADNFLL